MGQPKRPYVQFSKRIVVAVFIAVTAITIAGLIIDWLIGDAEQATHVIRVYVEYAMVVFAAYSGNSIAQKIITSNNKSRQEQPQG